MSDTALQIGLVFLFLALLIPIVGFTKNRWPTRIVLALVLAGLLVGLYEWLG